MDNTNIENTDPRKVGTSGLEGLKSFLGDSKDDSYENLEYLRDFIKTPSNSKERIALLDKGAYEASGMVETIPALDLYGYGESGDEIDREISEVNDLKNLEDYRATHQTAYEKLGNGLMKMASLAKNTYLETVGLGINSILSEGKEEGFNSVWNQDHAKFSYQAMKEMEKEYPNFYSEEEQEAYATGKWYTQLDTANFWGDHFLKNLGFTIGAGLGATASPQGFMIKLMSGIPVAGKYIARTLGTMFASAGEANVEAFHAYQEFKEAEITKNTDKANAYYSSIANKYTKRLEELQSKEDAINKILSNNNVSRNDKNILLQSLDAILKEKTQIEEAWAEDYQNYTATLDSLNADIEKRAIDVGNVTWAANFALLSVTEYFSFGKLFSAGRSVKRGIDIASNRAKSTLGASIAKGMLWEAVQEGPLEEMGQKLISESAKSTYSANDPDSYYDAYIYNKHNVDVNDWQYGLIEGFNNSYGSSAAWEEGFIGAITGGTPMPATNLPFLGSGTDSDDTIGKGKIIGLRGGITGAIAEYMRNKDKVTQQVNTINGFLKRFVDDKGKTKDALAAHLHFLEVMDGLSYTDDEFSYRNARDSSDFALIQAMSEAGLQKHLDKMLNIDFDSMSDEELNSLAKSMNWYTPGTNNKEPITATEAGKKEIIKQLKQNQEAIRTSLNNYRESVEAFSNDPKYRNLSADQITQLAWLDWKIKAFAKRKYDIQEEEKTKIAPLISDIDDAISSLENINESKDNVKTLKKLKEVLQGLLDNKEVHSLFKDNKEITDFFSNPLVSTLLSAKEDSIVAANKVLDRLRDSVLLEKLGATYAITLADYIMNPGKLAAKNKEKVQEKQEEKINEEAKKLEDKIDNMPPSEIMEDDLEQLSLEQLHNSIASSPLVQKIKNKINKAKEAKKDLDTLFNIIDSLQLEEDEALEDRDAYNGMLEHAKNAIDRIFKKALDENRINEFLDINSNLWEEFHNEFRENGNEVLETSRYIISLILEEFRSSKEFQNSVPNKVDNSIPQLNTSGRDNNPEVNPSPDPKDPGNTSNEKILPFEGKEEEETLEEEIKSSKNYLPVFRRSPNEIYKYWKSSITEFWLSLVNDVLLPTKKAMKDTTPNGYDAIRKKKVIALWDKLKEENAFKNINTLKEGDEIVFRIDYNFIKKHSSIFNNKEDYPIFIYSNNKLIGVLPDETSRSTNPQQLGLSEVISDIYKKASKAKDENENIEFFEYEHKSKIADTLQGRIIKSKESKKLNEIFESVENVHIGVCIGGNISVVGNKDNIKVRPLARSKEGKPYVLIPIQDSIFTHAAFPFSMASVFTEDNATGLNKILSTVISNFSGKNDGDIYKILNSLIFEKIRVNTSGNTLTIAKEDGKDRINIYNGNSSDTTAIIEAFKRNNLHFNIYNSLQSKNTPALFGQFGIKVKDYIDSMKQSVEVKISNLSDSPTDTPIVNNWYTIIPINTKGEFLEYERPQHIKTNNPVPNSNPVQQASDKKIATNALSTPANNNVYVPPVASTPPVEVVPPSTSESLRESIRSLMKGAKIKSKGIDSFIEENTDNISNLEKLYNVLSSTESSSKLRIALNTNDSKDAVNHFLNPENNDPVDSSIDQSNANDDFDYEDLHRVQNSNKYSIIDIQKEMKWFKEVFPNLPEDRIIKHVENLIRIKGNNYAYGMYKRGVITLSELAASGTLYHEAFHFVFDLFVSREEKEKILEEGRKVYLKRGVRIVDKYKDIAVEEQLAEAFRRYVQFEETPIIGSLVHIFRQLKHFIQSFLGNEAYIDNLFYRINNAKIDTSEVQPSSSVVRLKEESYTQEMLDIKAKAIADGTFMKAPNGKPSNLNERQWLHVRTKAFKRWFGDWEKIAVRNIENASNVYNELNIDTLIGRQTINNSDSKFEGGLNLNNLPDFVSEIDSHGIAKGNELQRLLDILNNGIDKTKTLYTAPLAATEETKKAAAALGTAGGTSYRDGLFIIAADFGKTLNKDGIGVVFINDMSFEDNDSVAYKTAVKLKNYLQEHYPNIDFRLYSEAKQYYEGNEYVNRQYAANSVSKVVDENGEPKEVYHGTSSSEFYSFDLSKSGTGSGNQASSYLGFFFTDNENTSKLFSGITAQSDLENPGRTISDTLYTKAESDLTDEEFDIAYQQYKKGENWGTLGHGEPFYKINKNSRVISAFINLKNPEIISAEDFYKKYAHDKEASEIWKEDLKNKNHDGIIIEEGDFMGTNEFDSNNFVVFNPNQIKSATDNIGTYSEDNDDIRYREVENNTLEINTPIKSNFKGKLIFAQSGTGKTTIADNINVIDSDFILGSILGVHASQAFDAFKSLSNKEKQKISRQYEQAIDDAIEKGKTVITARINSLDKADVIIYNESAELTSQRTSSIDRSNNFINDDYQKQSLEIIKAKLKNKESYALKEGEFLSNILLEDPSFNIQNEIIKKFNSVDDILKTYLDKFRFTVEEFNESGYTIEMLDRIIKISNSEDITEAVGELIAFMSMYNSTEKQLVVEMAIADGTLTKEEVFGKNGEIRTIAYRKLNKSKYFKVIGKSISEELKYQFNYIKNNGKVDNSSVKESLLNKIRRIIKDFFNSLLGFESYYNLATYARQQAIQALALNDVFIKKSIFKPGDEQAGFVSKVDLIKALDENPYEKDIISKMTSLGFSLAGSVSMSVQGTVYRPAENPLHDIDFDTEGKNKEYLDKVLPTVFDNIVHIRTIPSKTNINMAECETYLTMSVPFEIIRPNGMAIYVIKHAVTGEIIASFVNSNLEILKKGIQGKFLDFFVNKDSKYGNINLNYNGENLSISNYRNAMYAKLYMYEDRLKDIWNFNRFVPNKKQSNSKGERLSAEDKSSQESLDIMDFGSSKLSYDNLSFDDILYLSSMNVDRDYYESLSDMQKELMLKCR